MKNVMVLIICFVLGMIACDCFAQSWGVVEDGENVPAPITADNVGDAVKLSSEDLKSFQDVAARKGPTRKQRREMGITFKNIRLKMKEMLKTGELEGMSNSEMSAAVLDQLVQDNPKAFADPGIDWDGLLGFIERLIPLIIRLMQIFAMV